LFNQFHNPTTLLFKKFKGVNPWWVKVGASSRGRFEHVRVSLILAIHGSKSPGKTHQPSPTTTHITVLTGGERARAKENAKKEMYLVTIALDLALLSRPQ